MAIAITILGLIILALCFLVAVVLGIGAAMGDEAMDAAIRAKRELDAEREDFARMAAEAGGRREKRPTYRWLPSVSKGGFKP